CFFFQAEDGIRDRNVTGVQTCALPISKQAPDQYPAQEVRTHAQQGRQIGSQAQPDGNKQLEAVSAHATTRTSGWHRLGSGLDILAGRRIRINVAHARPSTPISPCGLMIRISAMAANSMTSE